MSVAQRSEDLAALPVTDLYAALLRGVVPVDVRSARDYLGGHIPGAISVPFARKGMGEQLRQTLPPDYAIALVAENEVVAKAAAGQFAAAGYRVRGFLDGGMAAWQASGYETETVGELSVQQLHGWMQQGKDMTVLDVRDPYEWAAGHVPNALHIPLGLLMREAPKLDRGREYAVICATGARSSIACAILQQAGVGRVYNVFGGMSAWAEAGLPVAR